MDLEKIAKIAKNVGTPCFIYEQDILQKNIKEIFLSASKHNLEDRIRLYISYFANSNPILHSFLNDERVGLLLQTEEEWYQLQKYHLHKNIIVSPSYLSDKEIDFWIDKNIIVNLASLEEVEYVLKRYSKHPISFRIDCTFWQNQRTGIKKKDLPKLLKLLHKYDKKPHSFHVYTGTGSSLREMKKSAKKTLYFYKKFFPNVSEINFGGGFAFDYNATESKIKHFSWDNYFSFLSTLIDEAKIPKNIKLIFEPGRDVLADTGCFVIKVKRVIRNNKIANVSTDGSFVYIPSAIKRTRVHQLNFITGKPKGNMMQAMLSGSTTLSSDYVIPMRYSVPSDIQDGDLIVVRDVGAYGATQHLEFLNKRPAPEVLVVGEDTLLISERGALDDKVRNTPVTPQKIIL